MKKNSTNIASEIVFSTLIKGLGTIDFIPLNIQTHIPIIHDWVNREYAQYWGMIGKSCNEIKNEYEKIIQHSEVFLGQVNGEISFLLEKYNPKNDPISDYYKVKDHDCGIHVIVAPTNNPIHQFTWNIFTSIMKFVFSDLTIERIVVEPDIRNEKMFKICHRIGFKDDKIVELPHKTARLSFCTRRQFIKKIDSENTITLNLSEVFSQIENPEIATSHINEDTWGLANKLLVKKAISEFSHESIFTPTLIRKENEEDIYQIISDNSEVSYSFKAKKLALNHWLINENSIIKNYNPEEKIDAVLFFNEYKNTIGISDELFPSYIEEIISTLQSSMFKLKKDNLNSHQLVYADFQTIEQSMNEGHPGFVANNGRIGFNSTDYKTYTPETGNPFQLVWLAGKKDRTVYAGTQELDYDTLIRQELGDETIEIFNIMIKKQGKNPSDYFFMPTHPWQWFNKLAIIFSPEIAQGNLICLGYGTDYHQAQQSIRTLFNISHPQKLYTKTSLSILNMGFMRGLPVYYLGSAPEMAKWLEDLLKKDHYLQQVRFGMLGEVASISYINPYFESYGKHNPYNKMIASLWRESPVKYLQKGEQLMTMAALLHIDKEGNAFLTEMIKASKMTTDKWLKSYFSIYLTPLLHCFYEYDLVFMPHGENLILGLKDHVPVRSFMKDITEEAVILNPEIKLPTNLERMYAEVPEDVKLLSIFIDIFDGFFRFMSAILVSQIQYDENRFWELVAESIQEYQQTQPHLETKFEKYDLFTADFELSCLNRLQLNNNKTMIDLDDPVALLQFQGKISNPIAPYKKVIA
ncbi:GNAT family N-acetyltransferase [Flavobacterium columnare]|uniref:GNAT family N-acetyltransferase n=1 Tax=Flavobacterium columnare TaxID=996 RepID=A0A437UDJ6_9FLAO|nr:GNAT family N-acetyltransferase [Flavobacterium columnare]RVU91727.1 GNAT family N-acetyltransferase [Flavobacterium columnare]